MIDHPLQSWLPLVVAVRGTVIPRIAMRVVALTAIAAVVTWLATAHVWEIDVAPVAHDLVGVALGLLLVFRANASYDRDWKGRKQWGGVVDNTRNLVRAAEACAGPAREMSSLATAYALALKQHLRADKGLDELAAHLPAAELTRVAATSNPPLALTQSMSRSA